MEKRLTLKNELTELAQLPILVEELRKEIGLNEEECFNLNLALEEAVTNVISYAFTDDEVQTFTVDVLTKADQVEITITDNGVPFDPTEVPAVDTTAPAEERQIGGLGIFLIMQLMSDVKYQRINNTNVLTLIQTLHNS